ncbi:uncharacterized RNA-binding protein C428.12c-like [Andrographis paniculata]|uniref:uncharacterized RNA-binding protein C428.12c-like n=1 Tax=Andrographis paniculata TaxID=175694 RepID=UPI0021E8215E|nr:uncharacterized RNA-binding protein C428.12c-like [Andrographis paniculata]XP_051143253.1 uncharacterized RNA-binding protein C428.12c-like [Andrographis paniculata]XP_051143254.1 uncharacterized RNA-binding protein C428.12c-like [Andrographis paniculata]XP_051143255.1 uncharacterized RNA-binding protein C428.12c-like [Andrographis paniculata]XP_051143256.1 uncharacterized RNA-binding protein C428.12c-like [Andrographis paniculata]
MGTTSEEEEYASFLEKVKRTIYVDNLAPQVTESVLKAAFNQFGNVISIQITPNYLESKSMPQSALVEMETPKQVKEIVFQMANFPFMISGMPRPVRAYPAKMEMFDDCPRKPGRKIECRWLDPKEPEFEVAQKIKHTVRRHAAEASLVLEQQRIEEEKLGNQQSEMLKSHYKKFELLEGVFDDGTTKHLARHYNMPLSDS